MSKNVWIKVTGEDGNFFDSVPSTLRHEHLKKLKEEGYYAVQVKASEVPPCRFRDFRGSLAYYFDGVRQGGTDFYHLSTDEDIKAMEDLRTDIAEN